MVAAFLAELRQRGVEVSADGERLRCTAPPGVLTPELRDQLQQRKGDILAFLRAAEALSQQQRAVVPLQPNGTRTPVFGVGGHNGDVFCYRTLVQHLGEDQPFFGLQPPGLDGQSEPLTRVEDLAEYFARQVRAFRRTGPYIIVGFCAGGGVAFELARQLVQAGERVNLVGLFGSPFPRWYRSLPQLKWWLTQRLARVDRHVRALISLPFGELRLYIGEQIRRRRANREAAAAKLVDPVLMLRANLERTTLAALSRYTPGQFAGRVGLFLPSRAWGGYGAAAAGWRSVAPLLEAAVGPDGCDGDTMLREHAVRFAELFRRCRDAQGVAPATPAPSLPGPLLAASVTH